MPSAAVASAPSKTDAIQRRQLLAALRAFRRGDFDVRMPDGLEGLDGQIAEAFNDVVVLASSLAEEASTVRDAIGIEGRMRQRMRLHNARGGWASYGRSINELLDDVTSHSNEMARVITAVARGDLQQTIDVEGEHGPLRGDFLKRANAVNGMVDQLARLGSEVTRVAQEVGVEGKLGAQAKVPGVSGAWKELTESVNLMASNLTGQVREIARVTTAVAQGDLTKTVNIEVKGEILELKNTMNTMVDQLGSFADEVTRVAREVGTEGRLGGQARVRGVSGVWRELTENVNSMAANLTGQVRNIAEVSSAIARGDLSRKITVEVRGEILELKNTINTMVDQLSSFADEVTRVAREVGSEGVLGGQAEVSGASGVWRELTENVNSMANNLTGQVRNIAEVVTAIATGDLSKKITVDAKGEILALKTTINTTVDKLNHFAAEVTRVARLVGTEGTLGVQAEVKDVSGIWKELTDNVNAMGSNLTVQVRDIAEVTTAVANGDLSKKITVEVQGEILQLKNTINAMVDSLGSFADEVTRMAREVGTEGVLGGQAVVREVRGVWKELTDNVNSMATNLTNQVRNISEVSRSVATGDLSRKITVDARGEVLELKDTINAMVDQLNAFAAEVTRVSRDVGVEGKLGGQAEVEGVRGIWKELTDNVNLMADNLTAQVRDIAQVTTAVAAGDLSRKITVDARGEILELKNTINTMVDQLSSFADEVTRLASEVGVEGRLGGQADVRGVSGTWRGLTDAVNSMASNLTDQVRSISQVAAAIAEGNLRRKITVDARGEILDLKNTINTMVDQLSSFAEEVTRVAREVGTEGKLGGQASVEGVRGTWKELTDNVNLMADNLTAQVRDIARVSSAIAEGDLSRTVTVEVRGEMLDLKETINRMIDQLSSFADEVTRVARDVGVEGKLGGQAEVRGVSGIWKELTDNVNLMASNLTAQVRDIAQVTTSVANGDLSRKITVEVKGEILKLKQTVNTMVDQLSAFAEEVTRVAREVGSEGILGGQAQVPGVSGTWRELTTNVNDMARNLTEQVRGIARVVTAAANGDLKQELRLDAKGEIATLVTTINDMIVTLSTFADQVSSVARDVGVEGKLGGQADVPGAAGIWRDLTNNVNELAGNLTRQVRAIGDVATAVTKGELTQTIDVEARGEVAELKDNLNQMIRTLAETTLINQEQDWLKTNLTRFTRMLQGQRELTTVAQQVLSELAPVVDAQHGAFYVTEIDADDEVCLRLYASYAYTERKRLGSSFKIGESLVGQAAFERKRILVTEVPGDYIRVASGLGASPPLTIVVCPILFEGEVKGVIELATFQRFTKVQLDFIDQLLDSLGIVIATIEATMRTDDLLRQSQGMALELQAQQEELRQTNEELEEKARQLTTQRDEVERKNREVEVARQELEEKAEQLSLTSKYKSEFLANMSHELRTPLNSLLILSQQLAADREGNLTPKQLEYALTVHQAGTDLLALIDEILDLAKIESGTMAIDVSAVHVVDVSDHVERTFRQLAAVKNLDFTIEVSDDAPKTLVTDEMRLRQVMRNLISNALKFTEDGEVSVTIGRPNGAAPARWSQPGLEEADDIVAFSVADTGIGIAAEKHALIFEAFQQADGGTSRKFGGTGLGLSISREIAHLLGGELHVRSAPGEGSVFTLYLPRDRRLPVRDEVRGSAGGNGTGNGAPAAAAMAALRRPRLLPPPAPRIDDDRRSIQGGDRVLLVVVPDDARAREVVEAAREADFRVVVSREAGDGFSLAKTFDPSAIVLDLDLPGLDGWVVLDRFKHDPATRHVPVLVLGTEEERVRARGRGAAAIAACEAAGTELASTLERFAGWANGARPRLGVHGRPGDQQLDFVDALLGPEVDVVRAPTCEGLFTLYQEAPFDALLAGVDALDDGPGSLLSALAAGPLERGLPVLFWLGAAARERVAGLVDGASSPFAVRVARSEERLLAELTLHLHLTENQLPETTRHRFRSVMVDSALEGRRVLIVDDDVRNIFALTAVLEQQGMRVAYVENGREAVDRVERGAAGDEAVELVVMDVMMPEMDGYDAMRALRARAEGRDLPIIALTAKAMKGDREKCIEAGASDYITKPVDVENLLSLLRVWLDR